MGERHCGCERDFRHQSKFFAVSSSHLTELKRVRQWLVADNGIDWAISVAPDPRIPDLARNCGRSKGAEL